MELQQLRYVAAIAETGNFTRASIRCNVSQPSLSQQIIQLEREIGHKLFHRLGRKAVLTEAGTAFIERARRILFEVENATKELSDNPLQGRRIAVGSIPTLAPYLLPSLIARSKELYSNLQIDVYEDFKQNITGLLMEGSIDLAIMALPVKEPRLHVEPLLREPLLLVVAKNHPLASRPRVVADDLAGETFVMLGPSSTLAAQVQSFCGDHHFEPHIGFHCAQVVTVKAMVALGLGISILPRLARAPDDDRLLSYIELADGAPFREIGVVRHMQRYQTRGAEQFLALVREQAAAIGTAT
jgi:LysR family hydrogen peroxide-inducible transcriptional activator